MATAKEDHHSAGTGMAGHHRPHPAPEGKAGTPPRWERWSTGQPGLLLPRRAGLALGGGLAAAWWRGAAAAQARPARPPPGTGRGLWGDPADGFLEGPALPAVPRRQLDQRCASAVRRALWWGGRGD